MTVEPFDLEMMSRALALADRAAANGEVPVGALVVVGGQVVAEAHNEREALQDPTAHAELLGVVRAARALGRWRLFGATMYVTLEPCPMCAGALVNARVERLVYGAADPKAGAVRTLHRIADDPRLNHRLQVEAGVMAERCGEALRAFFQARRERK